MLPWESSFLSRSTRMGRPASEIKSTPLRAFRTAGESRFHDSRKALRGSRDTFKSNSEEAPGTDCALARRQRLKITGVATINTAANAAANQIQCGRPSHSCQVPDFGAPWANSAAPGKRLPTGSTDACVRTAALAGAEAEAGKECGKGGSGRLDSLCKVCKRTLDSGKPEQA